MPSGVTLMFAGFRSRWMMPALVRGFERLGDLPRDRQRLVERNRPARDALGERLAFDQFQDERDGTRRRALRAVDLRDVRDD